MTKKKKEKPAKLVKARIFLTELTMNIESVCKENEGCMKTPSNAGDNFLFAEKKENIRDAFYEFLIEHFDLGSDMTMLHIVIEKKIMEPIT